MNVRNVARRLARPCASCGWSRVVVAVIDGHAVIACTRCDRA